MIRFDRSETHPQDTIHSTRRFHGVANRYRALSVKLEASCFEEGKTVKQCDICRKSITQTIERLDHSIVIDLEIAATCTETGLTEGSHCGVCGEVLVEQKVIPRAEHIYARIVTEPDCRNDGNITLVCYCGESYRESTLFSTEKHDFVKNGDKGYVCILCGLEICEYGFADGSISGWSSNVRYYITGTTDTTREQERTLVIFGSGEMSEPKSTLDYPFRESGYVDEIKTVVICDGVTSVGRGAFDGSKTSDGVYGNPFRSVMSFIVKGNSLNIDRESDSMSGIECDVTYQR